MDGVKSLQSFKDACKKINNPIFERILQNQIYAMLRDLTAYKEDVYSLINGRIYYK